MARRLPNLVIIRSQARLQWLRTLWITTNSNAWPMTHAETALHQIIYISRFIDPDESVVTNILETALRYNPRNHITGMMLYADGDVIQVLEGPREPITALFERIQRDPRHAGVFVVLDEPVASRHFPDWSMGYKKIMQPDRADFLHYQQVFRGTPDAIAQRARSGLAADVIRAFCAWAMDR